MLKLLVNDCNFVRVVKLLAQNNMTANVDFLNSTITIEGELTESLATDLCEGVDILSIINFNPPHISTPAISPVPDSSIQDNISDSATNNMDLDAESISYEHEAGETEEAEEAQQHTTNLPVTHKYGRFRRGEIYMCNFGKRFGSEQAYVHPAIIIQNDTGNKHSTTTIVIPLTSATKSAELPTHLLFNWEKENMSQLATDASWLKPSTILAEQIRTVCKSRLSRYLGTLTSEFMDTKVQPLIEASLSLQPQIKTITEVKTVVKEVPTTVVEKETEIKVEMLDLKETQITLLSFVDVSELLSISNADSLNSVEKTKKILKLFGFDLERKGVTYILDAITLENKDYNVTLKELSVGIEQLHGTTIKADEIERLIVARIKENFNMKKSPAMHFIRLVRSLVCPRNHDFKMEGNQ